MRVFEFFVSFFSLKLVLWKVVSGVGFPILENCRICGRPFTYIRGSKVCEACRDDLDRIYFEARDILMDLPSDEKLDAIELANRLEVDPIYIYILAEEGRFDREAPWLGDKGEKERLISEFSMEIQKMDKERKSSGESRKIYTVERKEREER
ncbi:MAG TPA: hypothetical protein DEQ04_05695 [Thermovirga lienii]|nr:hypothetical protein [Thermovirga lienii]